MMHPPHELKTQPLNIQSFGDFDKHDPLLAWARQSPPFRNFAAGRRVVCLKCPNKLARPGLVDVLEQLASKLGRVDLADAPVLMFDHSTEGPPLWEPYVEAIHAFANGSRIPLTNIVFVTQNRRAAEQLKRFTAHAGFVTSYRILCFDHYLHQFVRFHLKSGPPPAVDLIGAESERLFLCTNRRPRAHRLAVMSVLTEPPCGQVSEVSSLWNEGTASFQQQIREAMRLFPAFRESLTRLSERWPDGRSPLPEEQAIPWWQALYNVPRVAAARNRITVVTESHFGNGSTLRITEKSLKPLLYGHPFVIAGECQSLALLESFGFDVNFSGLNRRYDEIAEPRERMNAVVKVLRSQAEAFVDNPDAFSPCREDLRRFEHNRNFLLEEFTTVLHDEADRMVISWLQEYR